MHVNIAKMAESMEGIAAIGCIADVYDALCGTIAVHERLTAPKHRPTEQDVAAATNKIKKSAAHIRASVAPLSPPDAPIAAVVRDCVQVLDDAAAQIAPLPTDAQGKRSMLDRFRLTKKPSKSDLAQKNGTETRLKESVAKLDTVMSLQLQ